jgi:hypothetical protein
MRAVRFIGSLVLTALAVVVVANWAQAQPVGSPNAIEAPRRATATAHIYLLKGLADVFSSGMDSLAEKLRRRGIVARVASHASSDLLAEEVIRAYRGGSRAPVIIAGHSLGADAAVTMSQRLYEAKVPVALVMTFGPLGNPPVMSNVARAVNYYQSSSAWRGVLVRGSGFRGSLANVNLDAAPDVNHFNIEKVDRIQSEAVNRIISAIGGARKPAEPKPAPTPAGEAKVSAPQAN